MRLFFACWPPDGVARALAHWAGEVQRECGGRAVPPDRIHLTLAFLGDADPAMARETARAVRIPASRFLLEQARYWGHNRIVWVGPSETPSPLVQLARALGEKRDFAAHVTLIRKARPPKALLPVPALEWPVTQFTLVNSVLGPEGPSYAVLERYVLE
jgi:2'-5' RNA ligase